MKKLFLLLVLLISLGFVSCSTDDVSTQKAVTDITDNVWFQPSLNSCPTSEWELHFSSDGTFQSIQPSGTCAPFSQSGTWTVSGNTLTLDYDNITHSDVFDIIYQTGNELKLQHYSDFGPDNFVLLYKL
jgi:hypothetical protein